MSERSFCGTPFFYLKFPVMPEVQKGFRTFPQLFCYGFEAKIGCFHETRKALLGRGQGDEKDCSSVSKPRAT
ncbi:hypothetical protein [Caproiciproducens sp. LBM24188]